MDLSRENAWALLTEHTKGESLIKHCLGVEAAVRYYREHHELDRAMERFVEVFAEVAR